MDKANLKFSGDLQNLEVLEGKYKGTYKSKVNSTCVGCAFYNSGSGAFGCHIEGKGDVMLCASYQQHTGESIIWIKTEETPKTTPRPHADLISRWVGDANLKVWSWRYDDWYCNTCPSWDKDIIYAVSTEKPTHTPMKMYIFTLIGKEYPITLPVSLSESEVEANIKERVFEITEFSYKEV